MQIIQIEVEDNKLDTLLTVISNLKEGLIQNCTINNEQILDKNTISYIETKQFKDDKAYFQKCLDDIESNENELVPFDTGLDELNQFIDRVACDNSKAS